MKTPYDAALRVADKRLDKVRAEMAKVANQLQLLEREGDAAANALVREGLLAMDDPRLTTERYFVHARDRRTQLMAMRDSTHAQLEALRHKAVAHYAERIAIDTAIANHREEAERAAAAAEQTAIDDLTGSRYRPAASHGTSPGDGAAVIDRTGLQSLPPAKRAELIFGEAQASMAKRLWQAALGDGTSNGSDGDESGHICPIGARPSGGDSLEAMLASLTRGMGDRDPITGQPPAPNAPADATRASAALPAAAATAVPAAQAPSEPAAVGDKIGQLGPNTRYATTIAAAAERVGVPAPALAAIVDAEAGKGPDGSWQCYSRNPRSSAAGLGQFLNRTWEGLAETRGTWLNDHAARQGWLGANGQVRAESRAAVLATRYDPVAAINGIADYARQNLNGLRRAGVTPEGDVGATARLAYLGHHLGLGDAVRFLRGNGLSEGRARVLLDAQVGATSSSRRIAAMGDATSAHREWLVAYLDRKVRPARFAAQAEV